MKPSINNLDPARTAERVIELLGGRENAKSTLDNEHQMLLDLWVQNTHAMGRILRSHLFVEHFLTTYLTAQNPNIQVDHARLTFAQKVALIAGAPEHISHLFPGIRRLNAIRNRMAHTLSADITEEDRLIFLGIPYFVSLREALAAPDPPSNDNLDILDDFAKYAGSFLHGSHSESGKAFKVAFQQISDSSASPIRT